MSDISQFVKRAFIFDYFSRSLRLGITTETSGELNRDLLEWKLIRYLEN